MTRKTLAIPTGLLLTGAVWPVVSRHNARDTVSLSNAGNAPKHTGEEALRGDSVKDGLATDENQNDAPHWLEESWPAGTDLPLEGHSEATAVDASDNPNEKRDAT